MTSVRRNDVGTPMSWAESSRSVLKLNIRHLWLCGVWPLPGSWVFYAYAASIFGLGVWNAVEGPLAVYFCWGDLQQTTMVFMNTFTNGSGLVKMAFFLRNTRQFNSLVRHLDALMSEQVEACSTDAPLGEILQASRRRAFRLSLGMVLFMASQGLVWFPMPLMAHPGERLLPFVQHFWDNNTNYYELSYVVQCVAGLWMAEISFGMDCLFASIMILAAAQLEILSGRVIKLGELSCFADKSNPATDTIYKELCRIVESHQKILRFVARLQDTMSPIAMTQFVCSVLVLCVTLFQATYNKDIITSLSSMTFLSNPCGQVYLYCWAAHNVAEKANAVSTAAYSCSWVEGSARFKRTLRILISRAQKPLVLTAGSLYPIDRAAFLSLVNTSYSYYALLGQINNR
ncbi:odorant receptor Or2-like [Schistocerca nitens]|uniref:odorant receptor Or2-like n=1 Tax=Schistocerca nitens TaxID=7011 RepID=UPI0021193748|nr:odorant receptor Or2-like [Schistocerca nitens]